MAREITLGVKARDVITGFEGVVTGHCRHLTGCDTYGLTPPAKDGKIEAPSWFDENRIEVLAEAPVKLFEEASRPGLLRRIAGGPQDVPAQRSAPAPSR